MDTSLTRFQLKVVFASEVIPILPTGLISNTVSSVDARETGKNEKCIVDF
jgi:hypothetical protein